MRIQTAILLILLLLCGFLWFTLIPAREPDKNEAPVSDIRSAVPAETPPPAGTSTAPSVVPTPGFSNLPVFAGPLPELGSNTGGGKAFRERIVTEKLPGILAEKEGSYTSLSDLFRGDGTFSVDLRSDWATRHLLPERNLPDLRMRIIKNPQTGEYEPAGGTLKLPGSSLEAGYEVNPATEENKATLQWKKSF